MDDANFDNLTRSVARRISRRQFMAASLGAAAGATVGAGLITPEKSTAQDTCLGIGETCTIDAECCSPYYCLGTCGFVDTPADSRGEETCLEIGQSCATDAECCSPYYCLDETCGFLDGPDVGAPEVSGIDTLPATGTSGPDRSSRWLPLAAAGAVAAGIGAHFRFREAHGDDES